MSEGKMVCMEAKHKDGRRVRVYWMLKRRAYGLEFRIKEGKMFTTTRLGLTEWGMDSLWDMVWSIKADEAWGNFKTGVRAESKAKKRSKKGG